MKWLIALALIVALAVGCETPTYKTTPITADTGITVDRALKAWGKEIQSGRTTVDQRRQVRVAYTKYRAAMIVAEQMAIATINNSEAQFSYITTLNTAGQVSFELIALIETFRGKRL